jgi:PAS domain S-box-containing protein
VSDDPSIPQALIVEDSPAQAAELACVLEEGGFSVEVTLEAESGFSRLGKSPYDVVVTDLNLHGSSGFDLCRRIKQDPALKSIPVVIITAENDPANVLRGLEAGADGFMTKHRPADEIVEGIRRIVTMARDGDKTVLETPTRIVFLQQEFEISAGRESLITIMVSAFEDVVALSEDLRKSEDRTRSILDAAANGIIVTDIAGNITLLNPAAVLTFGFESTARDALGKPLTGLLAPESRAVYQEQFTQYLGGCIAPLLGVEHEFEGLRRDGTQFPLSLKISEFRCAGELGLIAITQDVSERKEAEAGLVREEARKRELQLKDDFLSHVSHELRTPMTAIHQFVTILRDGLLGELQPEQYALLGDVMRNVNQLKKMIGDLMEIARVISGKLTVEPRRTVLDDVLIDSLKTVEPTAAEKEIELRARISPNLPRVNVDAERIRQVLGNLIENALKFTPPGGSLTLTAGVLERDPNFVHVSLADTGCGISEQGVKHIFDRLYQEDSGLYGSRKGLGLGLHICKQLISAHGGELWVESEIGKGATFHFTVSVFSLMRILEPFVDRNQRQYGTFCVVTVVVGAAGDDSAAGVSDLAISEVRQIVNRCVLPDVDLVLPRVESSTNEELIVVATACDERGARVMVERIRDQLSGSAELQAEAVQIGVRFDVLRDGHSRTNESVQEVAREVADRLGCCMQYTGRSEGRAHEQQEEDPDRR